MLLDDTLLTEELLAEPLWPVVAEATRELLTTPLTVCLIQ